jgi:hypothetical protein
MVIGSFASTLHGQPRTTQNIDLVIHAGPEELDRLLESLPKSAWYLDADASVR